MYNVNTALLQTMSKLATVAFCLLILGCNIIDLTALTLLDIS